MAPRASLTDLTGTLTASATALSAASVARPDSARSTTRTTRAPSKVPPTIVREEPGRTWTSSFTGAPSPTGAGRKRDTRLVGLRRPKNGRSLQASPELHGEPTGQGADQPVISPEGLGAFPISSVSGLSPSAIGVFPLDVDPALSTPLDADSQSEEAIPRALWWAMKDRKHHRRLLEETEPGYLRSGLGHDDSGLYFVDDGGDHCMIGRLVGSSSDGCEYCLVARVPSYRYDELRDGDLPVSEAFSDARDVCLCCVFADDRTSDITVVEHYRHAADIPPEYLSPSPLIEFTDEPAGD